MTTIAILAESGGVGAKSYRAVAGNLQAVGQTAGQALDALTAQLADSAAGSLVIVQHARVDEFFNAQQRRRLEVLLGRWRAARSGAVPLPAEEQQELEALVEAEVQGAGSRAAALAHELGS